jgi:hypothetical protein
MPSSPEAANGADQARAQAIDLLRGRPNPFENLVRPQRPDERFADLHVPALLREPRELLLQIIDTYRLPRYTGACDLPDTRVVIVQGARGAGKTHMLDSLAHRPDGKAQVLVRPGLYDAKVPFEEYLLNHLVNTLLAEDPVQGHKPFADLAAQLTRRLLRLAVRDLGPTDRLFACSPSRRQRLRLLWSGGEALSARFNRFAADLAGNSWGTDFDGLSERHDLPPEFLPKLVEGHVKRHEAGTTALSAVRRLLYEAMAKFTLRGEEDAVNRFLEADYTPEGARPFFRADVVRQQLHALVEACALVQLPVVFAFDNLEGFLAPQNRFDAEVARAFMDNLAQAVDGTRGLLLVLFAEQTLLREVDRNTHQFALDRIRQGVPLHARGPIDRIELKPPVFDEVRQLIAERVDRLLKDFAEKDRLPAGFPYGKAFLDDLAGRRDLELRNKMLRLRDEYSQVIYDRKPPPDPNPPPPPDWGPLLERTWTDSLAAADRRLQGSPVSQLKDLHAGLGKLLQQAGPVELEGWRLAEVQPQVPVGDHPAYGVVTVIDWQPVGDQAGGEPPPAARVGVGILLAGGPGMPRDLRAKFDVFQKKELRVNCLVVLSSRSPDAEDQVAELPAGTRQVWDEVSRRRRAVIRPVTQDDLRWMLAVPEWLDGLQRASDQPVPEPTLRSFIRQRCPSLLQAALPPVPERTAAHAD